MLFRFFKNYPQAPLEKFLLNHLAGIIIKIIYGQLVEYIYIINEYTITIGWWFITLFFYKISAYTIIFIHYNFRFHMFYFIRYIKTFYYKIYTLIRLFTDVLCDIITAVVKIKLNVKNKLKF